MPYHTYILVSTDRGLRFYVGMSEDVNRRLVEHNSGKTKSTKAYRPWKIFFYEIVADRKTAREREKYWKSGTGRERIKVKWSEINRE